MVHFDRGDDASSRGWQLEGQNSKGESYGFTFGCDPAKKSTPASYARMRLPRGMIYRSPKQKKSVDLSMDDQINKGLRAMGEQSFEDFHFEVRHREEPITAAKKLVGSALHFGSSSDDNFSFGCWMLVSMRGTRETYLRLG